MEGKFKYSVLALILLFTHNVKVLGQDEKLNSLSVEVGGLGGLYSINYGRDIPLNEHFGINLGIGLSQSDFIYDEIFVPGVPAQLNVYYRSKQRHQFDIGIGFTPYYASNFDYYRYQLFSRIGYKYHFSGDKFYIGVSFTPGIYESIYGLDFVPWAGVSFGYRFNKIEKIVLSEMQNSEKHKMTNISLGAGFIFPKLKLQFEKAHKENTSYGLAITDYYTLNNGYTYYFPGVRLELFYRWYNKKRGNKEGMFFQTKFGSGYQQTGYYQPDQKPIYGLNFGGGIAVGYKLFVGNHLTVEPILGVHWYLLPSYSASPSENTAITRQWYETIGMPLDFQFKFGWQY
jgi:hypothetical protein